jgi:polar amino acid transport system substrate-binding protein
LGDRQHAVDHVEGSDEGQSLTADGATSLGLMSSRKRLIRVGAAFPDPPFNSAKDDGGLDISLMRAIADMLGMQAEFISYEGADFNGIFAGLDTDDYDCVIAGTTVTPERQKLASFCEPYLVSGQSLAVDVTRHPHVRTIDDLADLTIGVQHGNTSQPIAEHLVALGKAKAVRIYNYGSIRTAIEDLRSGPCDAFMKLAPVLTELVRDVDDVEVVQRGLSTERIAIAVRSTNTQLLARINEAQAELERDGRLPQMRQTWLGSADLDQTGTQDIP